MKKFIYSAKIAFSALVLSSCLSQLDLEPAQDISENLALNSARNVRAVLAGAYDRMGNSFIYGGYLLMNSELLGSTGNATWQGTFNDPREIFNKNILTQNANVANHWRRAYETINVANNIIVDGLTVIENTDERNRIEGEAKFIRAYNYFDLVRYFGKPYMAGNTNADNSGVPLILTPTRGINNESFVSRASIEAVYQQVIADLLDAESKLPESNGFFANRFAATALLSRVYLNMGRYAEARDAAHKVIAESTYDLVANYASIFNQRSAGDRTSDEDIFSMQVTPQDGVNSMVTFFGSVGVGGRGDVTVSPAFIALYEDDDQRKDLYYSFDGQQWTGKWIDPVAANVNLIRYSEMILTRAECNFRLGTSTGRSALEDINALRTIRGASALAVVDLSAILLERELELAFEGHKLHDYKRTQRNIGAIAWDANRLVYPIPFRELQTNVNLVQNPGYN